MVTPTILMMFSGGGHSKAKASTTYSEKLRQMMASCEGFMMMVDTQLCMFEMQRRSGDNSMNLAKMLLQGWTKKWAPGWGKFLGKLRQMW